MAELLGTVSAAIGVAQFTVSAAQTFVKLVKTWVDTDYNVETLLRDAETTHDIFNDFHQLLKPAATQPKAAAAGEFQRVLKGVKNCDRVPDKLHCELEKVVGRLQKDRTRIKLRTAQKMSWLFRAEGVREIRGELSRSQSIIMFGVSLTQVKLQLRAPVATLTAAEESRLRIYIKFIYEEIKADSGSISRQPDGGHSTDPNGIGVYTSSKGSPQRDPFPSRERLDRVPKSVQLEGALDKAGIRWLHDPFESDKITIYHDLSDAEYQALWRHLAEAMSFDVVQDIGLGHAYAPSVCKEDEEVMEMPMRQRETRHLQMPTNEESDPYEDIVGQLLDDWAVAPKKSEIAKVCGLYVPAGERMWECHTCSTNDETLICDACFKATGHKGHKTNRIVAQEGDYCDCGDETRWRWPVSCAHSASRGRRREVY